MEDAMGEAILWGGLVLACVVLLVIEWRIMRKPQADRSERERRYMTGSRKFARGYNEVAMKVGPIVIIVNGALLLLLSVLFWMQEQWGLAWLFTVLWLLSIAVALLLRWFIKKRRGPDVWAKWEAGNQRADEEGCPRWFGSTAAGWPSASGSWCWVRRCWQ
jgi:NADH:ubiquinone oxidoreductase subunit 3 (subunit A)